MIIIRKTKTLAKYFTGKDFGKERVQGPVSRKSRKRFGAEKPFLKLRPAYIVKVVFSYVARGIKLK